MSSSAVGALQTGNGNLQITGLASGLDTNSIVQALLQAQRIPINALTNRENALKSVDTQLTSIQSALRTLALNVQALADRTLFKPTQTATSTNSALVGATTTSSAGAVTGGYQVAVTALATSAQKTFTFTSQTSASTFQIDGQTVNLAANASAQDFVNAINSSSTYDVWATATNSGTVVLSQRTTGNMNDPTSVNPNANPNYINVVDKTGTLTQSKTLSALNNAGSDASYSINGGTAQTSWTNTVTSAIPGVTLTLNGTTSSTSPVTVNVTAPAANTSAIIAAVNTFVSAYNAIVGQINTQVTTKPTSSTLNGASLFGDNGLTALANSMRTTNYLPGAGLPSGMASLVDIGITTGAATVGGTSSQTSLQGQLTVNTQALTAAIQSNPNGVQQVLQSWSTSFSAIVNAAAQPGGSLDARLTGNGSQISIMNAQITTLNEMLNTRQVSLTAQFAALESALAKSQSENSWLTSQISRLP